MQLTSSFTQLLQHFVPVFTTPSFQTFVAILSGWVLSQRRRFITEVIFSSGNTGHGHWSCFHRFFSQAAWEPDVLSMHLAKLVVWVFSLGGTIGWAVDDTLCRKRGLTLYGAGMHHDPLLSKGKRNFFSFGHNWVVLSIQLSLPFAPDKTWSLPILMRLYRRKQKTRKAGRPAGERKAIGQAGPAEYRTRPQLAVEMISLLACWAPHRTIYLVGDSAYAGKSISRFLPQNVHLISRMVMNAALYESPPRPRKGQMGAPRKKGRRLPSPIELVKSRKIKWKKTKVSIYGRRVRAWIKTCDAMWYNSAGTRLLRIVVIRDPSGKRKDDCFFSTDRKLSGAAVIELYSKRWPLEVAFYNAKQCLGFEDPQNRTPLAVQRTAPMALCLHTLVILWFAKYGRFDVEAYRKARPWYRQKATPSFADMLECLRATSLKETTNQGPGQKTPANKVITRAFEAQKWAA